MRAGGWTVGMRCDSERALDDNTVAAVSRTSPHHSAAYDDDRTGRRRRPRALVGRADSLAAGGAHHALALVRWPLGGVVVPQLVAPSTFRRTSGADRGANRDVVYWRRRACPWYGPHRERPRRVPTGTMAGLVDRRVCVHRRRTGRATRAAVAWTAELLQRARIDAVTPGGAIIARTVSTSALLARST